MKPTWLERKRGLLLTQGLTNLIMQPTIMVTFSWWLGPQSSWGASFNFAVYLGGAAALALWVVGYRRHRLRMRAVALMLAVNGHTREELWDLLTNDIIDYATFARLFHA